MKYEVATCFNSFNINLFYLIIWSGPWLGDRMIIWPPNYERLPMPALDPSESFTVLSTPLLSAHKAFAVITNSSVALIRKQPPLVDEVSANFCEKRVFRGQHNGSLRPYSRVSRPEQLLFPPSSCSTVLTRLGGPRSRPTTSRKIW
jgi:hypothetical protein